METAINLAELQVLSDNLIKFYNKNLTDNEYKVLLMFKIYRLVSPKIIISKVGILKTNLALTLKKLVRENLVEVHKNPSDARGKQYCLTPTGERRIDAVLNNLAQNLSIANTTEFTNALKIVLAVLNKKL